MSDYPTEDDLQRITDWDGPFSELMSFVHGLWRYADSSYWTEENGVFHISTGGWSGNEDIIAALRDNKVFWIVCWYSNRRGGHYEFRVPQGER